MTDSLPPVRRVGFTVLELLVVIAIIGVVVAITLPALSQVRRRVDDGKSISTMRQLHLSLSLYMQDNSMHFPFFGTPGDPGSADEVNGVDISTAWGDYFAHESAYWCSLVLPYIDGQPKLDPVECFKYPFDSEMAVWCRFWMTCTAFAVPEFWHGERAPDDLSLLRGTRLTHMRQAARKGILLDMGGGQMYGQGTQILVTTGDGAVAPYLPERATQPVTRPYTALPYPTMSTPEGLAGIDF